MAARRARTAAGIAGDRLRSRIITGTVWRFRRCFRQGLRETGYIEGQNVTIEFRWAENHNERVPALIADLVQRHPSVLVAAPTVPALAAKAATATVPIVFECGVDPVAAGLVVV